MKTIHSKFIERSIFKGAHIVDPAHDRDEVLDILVQDGKIEKIGKNLEDKDASIVDVKGLHLFPGLIDLQVHFRDPGFEHKETIESGIEAAIAGGYCACVTMPNTKPACDNAQVVEYQIERGSQNQFYIFPAGTLTQKREGFKVSEMAEMKKAGAVAVTDDGDWLYDSGVARRAYEYAATYGLPVMTHAEDPKLSVNGVMNESVVSTSLGLRGKPNASEDAAVARDIELARLTGCHLHVLHVSTAGAVELIRKAKKDGLKVTAEASPHHIFLTDEDFKTYDTCFKMNPPLRTAKDQEALIEGLRDGTIDAIATDHAPHSTEEKDQDVEVAPDGVVGLGSALGVALTKLYHENKIPLTEIVKKLSLNPSEIISQEYLGRLKEDDLANFVLVDVNHDWTFSADHIFSKSQNSCFIGKKLKGKVIYNIVQGNLCNIGSDQ